MNLFTPLRDGTTPPVAVEIAAGRVTAATLERRGGQPVVSQHATELLPDGALVPSLTAANTHDRAAVMTALNRALERVGRPRRIGLVVPDAIANGHPTERLPEERSVPSEDPGRKMRHRATTRPLLLPPCRLDEFDR